MTARDSRRQRGLEARGNILEAATRLFARNGYAGVSMREVALAVGVTQSALYYHFTDKLDLYRHAVDHALNSICDSIEEAAADPAGNSGDRLRRVVACMVGHMSGNAENCILFLRVLTDDDRENAELFATSSLKRYFDLLMNFAAEIGVRGDARRWVLGLSSFCFMPFGGRKLFELIPGVDREIFNDEDGMVDYVAGLLEVNVGPEK